MRIRLRRGTAAQWASSAPVLQSGEPGWDTTNKTLKIGDGSTAWAALAAAGGSAGVDYKTASRPISGRWYRAPGNGPVGANLSMATGDRLYLVPFRLAVATTFDRIGIDIATAAAAGGVIRLGIWQSDAAGDQAGTLVLDAGTVASDSTGGKTITISQALSAGVYWLGACNQVATGAAVRATLAFDPLFSYFTGASMFTGANAPGSMVAPAVAGAFASNPTISDNDNGPIIGLRAA